jgi:hypothetical protein
MLQPLSVEKRTLARLANHGKSRRGVASPKLREKSFRRDIGGEK